MPKSSEATCDECYFRCAELCAIPGNTPCPTFRPAVGGALVAPEQPPLIARPLPQFRAPQPAAA